MAANGSPIAIPASVFSSTSLSAVAASNVGASFTFVTVMVTTIIAYRRPVSVAVTVTMWLAIVSWSSIAAVADRDLAHGRVDVEVHVAQ